MEVGAKKTPQREEASRVFGISDAAERFGVSTSTLKRGVKKGTFPAPIEISERRVGWLERDIVTWQQQRAEAVRAKSTA